MFIKLVVLILVCGSSGVGLLSVRQSRLQAAHEMAEARHRSQRLDERAGEVRAQIAQACTPERVIEMLNAQDGYDPAVHYPARFTHRAPSSESVVVLEELVPEADTLEILLSNENDLSEPAWMDGTFDDEHTWILNDGSRVILLNN